MNPRDFRSDGADERRTPEDRLLDVALGEALGGRRAPDLTDAVARALAEDRAVPARARIAVVRRARWRWAGVACGAAAAALLGWLAGALTPPPSSTPRAARVVVERGDVIHVDTSAPRTIHVATGGSLALHTGDRLRVESAAGAELRMGELGILAMAGGSEIEVLHMNWKDFGTGGLLGSITVAVAIGGVQWLGASTPVEAHEGQQLELTPDTAGTVLTSAQATELKQQLESAQARIAELETAAARRPVPKTADSEGVPDPSELAASATPAPPTFHYTGMDAALSTIDWKAMGGATAEMLPLLAELVQKMEDGEEISLELVGKIQGVNAELIKTAQRIMDGDIPGEGVNGSFTHPLVVANQLHAMFEASGMAMNPTQVASFQEMAARFAGEDEVRRGRYSEDTPGLQRVLDEMALKERFYSEARGALSPEQLGLITNPSTQGYTSVDIVGTGVAWATFAKAVPASDADTYTKELGRSLVSDLKLPAETASQVNAIIAKWAAQLPAEVWTNGNAAHTKLNFLPVNNAQYAGQMQLAIMQELLTTLPLTAEQRKKLLESRTVYVPVRS